MSIIEPIITPLTPEEKEKFYDDIIAPELAKLGKLCGERDLSFLCTVEFDPVNDGRGSTKLMIPGASMSMLVIKAAIEAQANLDAMIIGLGRYVVKQNLDHNSIYLELGGIKALAKDRKPC